MDSSGIVGAESPSWNFYGREMGTAARQEKQEEHTQERAGRTWREEQEKLGCILDQGKAFLTVFCSGCLLVFTLPYDTAGNGRCRNEGGERRGKKPSFSRVQECYFAFEVGW